jgi:hypothetical protein
MLQESIKDQAKFIGIIIIYYLTSEMKILTLKKYNKFQ